MAGFDPVGSIPVGAVGSSGPIPGTYLDPDTGTATFSGSTPAISGISPVYVSQETVEVLLETSPDAYVSQATVESLLATSPIALVSQIVVETLVPADSPTVVNVPLTGVSAYGAVSSVQIYAAIAVATTVSGVYGSSETGTLNTTSAANVLTTDVQATALLDLPTVSITVTAIVLGVAADVSVDTVDVSGSSNVLPLGVQAIGRVSSPLFWQTINDSQIANWQPVSDAQFGAWTPVDDGNIVVWTEIPT